MTEGQMHQVEGLSVARATAKKMGVGWQPNEATMAPFLKEEVA